MTVPPSSPGGRARACRALIGTLACGLTAIPGACGPSASEASGVVALAEALAGVRTLRPRISGLDAHARCTPAVDSTVVTGVRCVLSPPTARAVTEALLEAAPELSSLPGAEGLRAMATWRLLAASARADAENAGDRFERYAAIFPGADAWSDVAAARLLTADYSEDPRDLVRALDAADRALTLDGENPRALYNRALALERLFLRNAAGTAWARFVASESDPAWRAEPALGRDGDGAGTSGGDLGSGPEPWPSPPPRGHGESVGGSGDVDHAHATNVLLRRWAEAVLEDDAAGAASAVRDLARGGSALATEARDTWAATAAAEIAALDRNPTLRRSFAEALVDSPDGGRDGGAGASETPALTAWIGYDRARRAYMRFDFAASASTLNTVVSLADQAGFRFLGSDALSLRGLIRESGGDVGGAWSDGTAALELVRGIAGPDLLARRYAAVGRLSARLSGDAMARRFLHRAVGLVSETDDPRTRFGVLDAVAGAGPIEVPPRVVMLYLREALDAARATGDPTVETAALIRLSEILDRTGRSDEAVARLREAEALLPEIEAPLVRREMRSLVWLLTHEIDRDGDPEEALSQLREVTEHFEATDYAYRLARAWVARARAHLRLGDPVRAEAAFDEAIREVEAHRSTVFEPRHRARFLDRARSLFEQMVGLQLDRGDVDRAFEYFERTRSRVLLEGRRHQGGQAREVTARAAELVERIPSGVVVVTYGIIGDRVIAWVADDDSLRLRTLAASPDDLARRGAELVQAMTAQGDAPRASSLSYGLYADLVAPLGPELAPGRRLVVVPDRFLHALPFAALRNPETGAFLVEERPVSIAPSASWFAFAPPGSHRLPASERALLAIGNPHFDRDRVSRSYLPQAEREARSVASHYARADVWIGSQPTPSRFRREAPRYDVIHFAGHAVARPEAPLDSYLLLAAEPGDPGLLHAERIAATALPGTRLVVLSACETSAGPVSDTEGPASLARSFFLAGVPTVIASLWPVEDRSTMEFFLDFHQELVRSGQPLQALRAAQIRSIRREAVPLENSTIWAAFQLYGV